MSHARVGRLVLMLATLGGLGAPTEAHAQARAPSPGPSPTTSLKREDLPPNVRSPKGVTLRRVAVLGECGEQRRVEVTLEYDTPQAVLATLWGSIGRHDVAVPAGGGKKTYSFPSPVALPCEGRLGVWVALGATSAIIVEEPGAKSARPLAAEVTGAWPGPEYETRIVRNTRIAAPGIATFVTAYVASAVVPIAYLYEEAARAAPIMDCHRLIFPTPSSSCVTRTGPPRSDQYLPLFVPLVGPWIALSERAGGTRRQDGSVVGAPDFAWVALGVLQAAGMGLAVVGLATTRKVHRFVGPIEPRVGAGSLTLVGSF